MASYKLILSKQVRKKDLPGVPQKDRARVVNTISALRDDPRPAKATRLTNREEYRIRQGGYRILYTIEDTVKVVEVRKVAHRRNVYRG